MVALFVWWPTIGNYWRFCCSDWCIFLQLIIQQHNCVSISYTIILMKILLHQHFTVLFTPKIYTEIKLHKESPIHDTEVPSICICVLWFCIINAFNDNFCSSVQLILIMTVRVYMSLVSYSIDSFIIFLEIFYVNPLVIYEERTCVICYSPMLKFMYLSEIFCSRTWGLL